MAKRKYAEISLLSQVQRPSLKLLQNKQLSISLESRFADPTNDVAFKILFGSNKHKHLTKRLLNSLLGFKGTGKITD